MNDLETAMKEFVKYVAWQTEVWLYIQACFLFPWKL